MTTQVRTLNVGVVGLGLAAAMVIPAMVAIRSDFFKQARLARVKSPAELVIGTVRLAGNFAAPGSGSRSSPESATIRGKSC